MQFMPFCNYFRYCLIIIHRLYLFLLLTGVLQKTRVTSSQDEETPEAQITPPQTEQSILIVMINSNAP